jgi:hypothetical protein
MDFKIGDVVYLTRNKGYSYKKTYKVVSVSESGDVTAVIDLDWEEKQRKIQVMHYIQWTLLGKSPLGYPSRTSKDKVLIKMKAMIKNRKDNGYAI